MKELVENLIKQKKQIATMESCTGGAIVNAITNVEGASEILKFSAVTYSNEFKIKMGVSEETINKYSVYSMETADEMSKAISVFANSDIGIGITGKIMKIDKQNPFGANNEVFISIYNKGKDNYTQKKIIVKEETRVKNKDFILNTIIEMLNEVVFKGE